MPSRERDITRVTAIGAVINLALSFGKLVCGILANSAAMVADGAHSLSDLATDVVVVFFVRIAAKPADKEHDYGHGKFETLATVLIGIALAGVAAMLGWNGARLIVAAARGESIPQPGMLALAAAAVSIAAKEFLFRWTRRVGEKHRAPAVIANAWHHRSDAFSSIGTFVGIGGAMLLGQKWAVLDPIAAVAVAIMIFKVAVELTVPATEELLEKSLPKETEDAILAVVSAIAEISDPHNLRTRRLGANIAIELHIRLDPAMSVRAAHDITVRLENALKAAFGEWTHVILHVEPRKDIGNGHI